MVEKSSLVIKTIIVKGKINDPNSDSNYDNVELQNIIDERIKDFLTSREFHLMAQDARKTLVKDCKDVVLNHIKIKSKL
tara:strand:+ start:39 stop:275 length:237 start_codon:yes stop_codon:yes gene_type:complete